MKIAIDISPLQTGHKVRGTGFYLENLKNTLVKKYPKNDYLFFTDKKQLKGKIDIVHFPYFDPFFLSLPQTKKYKTVVTVHDLTPLVFPKEFPAGLKGNIMWQIQKMNLRKQDMLITDSYSSKKDIRHFTGINEDKISVVYLAAGDEYKVINKEEKKKKKEMILEKYDLPQDFFLYVGDATWNKNLPRLLNAAIAANVPIVLVGKVFQNEQFDANNLWNKDLLQIHELISKNKLLKPLGFLPTEDVVTLYNIANALVMPSKYEGFGLPVIEAMASGCPVITSNKGSLVEVAEKAALYIDPDSEESIRDALSKMWKNEPLQLKYTNLGLERAKLFHWDRTAEQTMAIYQKVASSINYEKKN